MHGISLYADKYSIKPALYQVRLTFFLLSCQIGNPL